MGPLVLDEAARVCGKVHTGACTVRFRHLAKNGPDWTGKDQHAISAPDSPFKRSKVQTHDHPPAVSPSSPTAGNASATPVIYALTIKRFRGIETLSWRPAKGANLILGGGDVGKTTILKAIALLLSPTNAMSVSDTDYYLRDVDAGFVIEGVFSLPPETGINDQLKPSWPWEWNGKEPVVPSADGEAPTGEPVYCLRVRGKEDLELTYEIAQPDGIADIFPVALRRSIWLGSSRRR
jgi:hypothetical protein